VMEPAWEKLRYTSYSTPHGELSEPGEPKSNPDTTEHSIGSMRRRFGPIVFLFRTVAELFDCSKSTARTWLRERDARFIVRGLSHWYFKPDVEIAKAEHAN
jgi:hypothetical protein